MLALREPARKEIKNKQGKVWLPVFFEVLGDFAPRWIHERKGSMYPKDSKVIGTTLTEEVCDRVPVSEPQ